VRIATFVWSVVLLVGIAVAQAPQAPAFEVASIKAAGMPTPDTMRSGQFRTGTKINAQSADFEFVTLADLVPYAYRVKSFQVAGPASMRETRWNIVGRLPEGASQDQVPEMMQALLIDRFKLAVHHEKREQPVYELTVAKGGAKLEPGEPQGDGSSDAAATPPGLPGFFPPFGGPPGGGPPGAGGRGADGGGPNGDGRGGRGPIAFNGGVGGARISPDESCGMRLEFTSLKMSGLADTLTPFLDRPVLDSTGLTGTYKGSLRLPTDVMFLMMQNMMRNSGMPPPGGPGGPGGGPGGPGGRGPDGPGSGPGRGGPPPGCDAGPPSADSADSSSAAIFQAVQRLGLKLQARKAPFDTIVVDHVEKTPTEN